MTGELGDYKKEIGYIVDVVNVASRIMEECKRLDQRLLISASLHEKIADWGSLKVENIGSTKLKGRDQDVTLYSVS